MNFAVILTYVVTFTACAGAQVAQPAAPPVKVLTIAELAAEPDKFLNSSVRVIGRLENRGDNYFSRTRRIVISDGNRFVDVKPWLPLSSPPSSPSGEQRPSLATYLDQEVEILGALRKAEGKQGKPTFLLEVKDARIVKPR
jgi:hypothetical protein